MDGLNDTDSLEGVVGLEWSLSQQSPFSLVQGLCPGSSPVSALGYAWMVSGLALACCTGLA